MVKLAVVVVLALLIGGCGGSGTQADSQARQQAAALRTQVAKLQAEVKALRKAAGKQQLDVTSIRELSDQQWTEIACAIGGSGYSVTYTNPFDRTDMPRTQATCPIGWKP